VATKQVADAGSSSPKGRRQTDLISSLWVSSALSAQVLARRVRLELEWKNLFLFQERQEKYLFPSSKGKFKSMTMETISGHSQTRRRREWVDSNRAEEFKHCKF